MSSEGTAAAAAVDNPSEAGGADFKATFALLPHVLKISKAVQAVQNDPQKQQTQIQAAVTDLQAQVQRCYQLLSAYPCLDADPERQRTDLEAKKQQLRHKCDLLLKYKNLQVFNAPGTKPSYTQ